MISSRIQQNIVIFWYLFRREVVAFLHSWKGSMVDNIIIATTFSLVFGYFMPAMGMPGELRMPTFLGTVIVFAISVANMVALNLSFDISGPNLFGYLLTLPTSLSTAVSALVMGTLVRSLCTIIPVLILGITFVGDWAAFDISLGAVCIALPLVLLFWTLLFLFLCFWVRKETMMGDIWPRLIAPMFCFGCVFAPWAKIARFSPGFAKGMLFNPMTHSIEIIRSAFLPSHNYIPFGMSAMVLGVGCILLYRLLLWAVKQRLQPVQEGRAL